MPWGGHIPLTPPCRCSWCSVDKWSCLHMLILCVFVCSCWRRGLLDPWKVSIWQWEQPHPCAVWRERPAPRGSNLLQGLCRPAWEAQSWLGWPSPKVESFISVFSSSLFEQHGYPYLCILRSGLAGCRENSQCFGYRNHRASVWFSLPVFYVLKLGVFRKEMLLKTVAETKAWCNQPAGVGVFYFACPPVCLCSQHSQGIGVAALPPLPQDFSYLQMLKWVFLLSGGPNSLTRRQDNWFSFWFHKCLKELKNLTDTIGFVCKGILTFSATPLTCHEQLCSSPGSVPKKSRSGENYSYTCFALAALIYSWENGKQNGWTKAKRDKFLKYFQCLNNELLQLTTQQVVLFTSWGVPASVAWCFL